MNRSTATHPHHPRRQPSAPRRPSSTRCTPNRRACPSTRSRSRPRTRAAVAETVAKQADAGVDVVSDGEMSKPSYADLHHRPARAASAARAIRGDLRRPRRLPGPAPQGVRGTPAARGASCPPATRDITVRDPEAAQRGRRAPQDRARPTARNAGVHERRVAGRHRAVPPQRPLHQAAKTYLYAIADAMRVEYEAVGERRASSSQIDCPDLAMGRHIQFADQAPTGLPQGGAAAHRGAQPRHPQHRPRHAQDARLLGQLRGPAPPRRPVRRTSSTSSSRRARTRSPSRPPTRATPTSGRSWRTSSCPTARS